MNQKTEPLAGRCLHCVVRDLVADDMCDNDLSTPTSQGANLGQAIGDIIGIDADDAERDGMSPDERYRAAVEAVAGFAVTLCMAASLPGHPPEQILFDASKLAPRLALIRRRG